MTNPFRLDDFRQKLRTSAIGRKCVYLDVTGSTMDDARKFGVGNPEEYPHGTIIMAERQTKARGARDHKWDASNTGNIYISIILHMPQHFKTFEGKFELEVAACMAVWSVTSQLGIEVVPKWPNDLWVRGHKLAGFLAEDSKYDIPGSHHSLFVLGMGINVNADVRQNHDLHSIATSLMCERNGEQVCREDLLSDVCLAFEHSLMSRSDNLSGFRSRNLFQKGCNISVTCSSEGQVMDGEFLEVCDNWEVRFMDNRTKKIFQGRSDYYTIRPKVYQKILVVFAGINLSRAAAVVASKLTTIIDTSKHVVCSVPESTVVQSDEWMKSCDLLVFAEDVCDSVRLTSKLKSYLKLGGNFLAVGISSYFAAKVFEIPFREGVLESLADHSNFSMISVELSDGSTVNGRAEGEADKLCKSRVTFPTSLIYFKFSKDYVLKCLTSKLGSMSVGAADRPEKSHSEKNHLAFQYCQSEGDLEHSVAILTSPTTHGGSISLFGFDLGVNVPSDFPSTDDFAGKGDDELNDVEKTVKELYNDRFRRDALLIQVLNVLSIA